jgi:hypothetical protein
MAGRPCNPNSDLKRLWQTLLPGTPFPQCGVPPDLVETESQSAEVVNSAPAEAAAKVARDPLGANSILPKDQR